MQKLIELEKDASIQVSSIISKYEKPDFIYIPVGLDDKIVVKLNDKVKIGTPLLKVDSTLITSPVSGKVQGIKIMNTLRGKIGSIEVLNDFEETKMIDPVIKKQGGNIKKDILDKLLKSHFGLDFNGVKNLILNCIDDDPYILTENFYLLLNYEGILESLDKLDKIYKFDSITICVKANNSENISKLMENLGMYPNIKLNIVPNLYLLGKASILLDYLEYEKKASYVVKASLFYHVYNLILRNRLINDKLITISGNGIKNPMIVRVKIGTKLDDVVKSLVELKKDNLYFIINGLMNGKILELQDFIITNEVEGLLIMKEKKEMKTGKCLNCGACIDICPVSINPLLLQNKDYLNKVKHKCLNCGLCSYICPVYINFNEYLEGD